MRLKTSQKSNQLIGEAGAKEQSISGDHLWVRNQACRAQ